MKNLFFYEIKKHYKVILSIMLIILLLIISENSIYRQHKLMNNSEILSYARSLFEAFAFLFIRLFLFGLFIYFGTDFINNLMSNEKNFLFSIPVKARDYFLSKILSITLMIGAVFVEIIYVGWIVDFIINKRNIDRLNGPKVFFENLEAFTSLYTVCLVALLLAYLCILLSKKYLEKSRFKFLWLGPFSIMFSIYYTIILIAFRRIDLFIFTPGSWILVIFNLILSILLFILDCRILENKTDL